MQIVVDGILTNYQILGNEKNKSILILHGWGRNLTDWLNVGQNLSDRYSVILLDLPGHGGTGLPLKQPYDTSNYADFAISFLHKIGIKSTILIGHSFGGKISIDIASKSKIINKLFLIDSSGVETKNNKVKSKIILAKIIKSINSLLPSLLSRKILLSLASADYKSAGELLPSFKKIVSQNVSDSAKNIKVQTYIIWGEKDKELALVCAKKLHNLISNSIIRIVWGAGHHPHLEKPDKFYNLLREYI